MVAFRSPCARRSRDAVIGYDCMAAVSQQSFNQFSNGCIDDMQCTCSMALLLSRGGRCSRTGQTVLSVLQSLELRKEHGIEVSSDDCPPPVTTFAELELSPSVMAYLRHKGYEVRPCCKSPPDHGDMYVE